MSILSGFERVKKYVKTSDGHKLLSHWTSSDTVEMNDGKTLTEYADNFKKIQFDEIDNNLVVYNFKNEENAIEYIVSDIESSTVDEDKVTLYLKTSNDTFNIDNLNHGDYLLIKFISEELFNSFCLSTFDNLYITDNNNKNIKLVSNYRAGADVNSEEIYNSITLSNFSSQNHITTYVKKVKIDSTYTLTQLFLISYEGEKYTTNLKIGNDRGYGVVKFEDGNSVKKGYNGYALHASEKNPNVEGSLASQIASKHLIIDKLLDYSELTSEQKQTFTLSHNIDDYEFIYIEFRGSGSGAGFLYNTFIVLSYILKTTNYININYNGQDYILNFKFDNSTNILTITNSVSLDATIGIWGITI